MSLVRHVTSHEGIDRESETASLQLGRRRSHSISYDPTSSHGSGDLQPAEKLDSIGADQISQYTRVAQVVVGVISCMLASGITFGYAALKTILVDEKVYRDLCTKDELHEDVRICYLQDQKLNLMFVVASVTANVTALPIGALLDRYGPRVSGIIGSFLLSIGAVFVASAPQLPFDAYITGYFLLAFGGTFVFVPSFHLSNAFPKYQGLILALVTGAFDASAAVFLAFRLLYNGTRGRFGLRQFFLAYLAVPILFLACQVTFMPARSYETRAELSERMDQARDSAQDIHDSDDELEAGELRRVRSEREEERRQTLTDITDLLGTAKELREYRDKEEEKRAISGVWGAMHGQSAWQQMRSSWFILIALLTVITMLRMNFFISTIWSQYRAMLDSPSKADRVNAFFDVALPIGGVATVPFIGLLLDHLSTVTVLSILVSVSTAFGILGVIPALWAAYCNVILFVLYRPLYYSTMSDYAAKVFGFATFGRIYGTLIAVSGLCTLAQPGLQALVHDAFDESPVPVNLILAGLGLVVGLTLVIFVAFKAREMRAERSEPGVTDPLLQPNRKNSGSIDRMSTLREAQDEV
ncbi:hypothetical protein DL764_005901 [Monosporascus ibericus]|uniref:Major facilitator superfamily (MFS) profile domain-containing protein n=1 Tax=Monosporascus ibericus TaxID=155417 RepID=A0A4Q4T706_9PEZI|nr:hypothetical protein DL764_005901 [Monosporascus ibericus]